MNYEQLLADLMGKHKYVLFVRCEHQADPHICRVPLNLDGSEGREAAAARFCDALVVSAHQMMEHHGRNALSMERIDGVPTAAQEQANEEVLKILGHK